MQKLVNRYLAQLNVNTELTGLSLIEEIKRSHIAQLPFSSANVLLEADLSTEPDALFKRIVFDNTGGYCFEHNKILYLVLKQLGFNVRPLIARVLLDGNENNGRLHRITLLELDNKKYIIDVGFGVLNPRFIVPLEPTNIAHLAGDYSLLHDEQDKYRLTFRNQQHSGLVLYRFDLAEYTEMDCEIGHFYSSQHAKAAFVNNLVVSRVMDTHRVVVRNHQFIQYNDSTGCETSRIIYSASELYSVLTKECLLNINKEDARALYDLIKVKMSERVAS